MKSFLLLATLSCLASNVLATHPGREIPEVQEIIDKMTRDNDDAVNYHGPTAAYKSVKPTATAVPNPGSYWLADIKHQGVAAFNPNAGYQVFRNVKDFGAKGDGVTDDTAAINNAISSGGRCGPQACSSSTTTPAVVYFPAGTYLISGSIIDFYFTQIIGNPNNLPILKATSNFNGFGLIDGDRYGQYGLGFGATNVFYRQVRNIIFDMTNIPGTSAATGIHWPTAQATSLQNCVFLMSDAPGSKHQGIFIEEGSGGFMTDLVFYGGSYGLNTGNQQFTMRNLTFHGVHTAINQIWDWGWTYHGINIYNSSIGLDMSSGGTGGQSVGSVTFIDSSMTDTKVGILTAHTTGSDNQPPTAGSLIVENVQLNNVPVAIQGPNGVTYLAGTTGSMTIPAWGQGHSYTPKGPNNFQGPIQPFPRPGSLLVGAGRFYARSKPQYATTPVSQFSSVRDGGAKGDGITDDTAALNKVIASAAKSGKIVFFDAGTYKVTSTINVPAGSKIVGESYSVIMGSGAFFSDMKKPQPMVQVGKNGEEGTVEWSDMIVATQGPTAGAILIEWNLASPTNNPSGMWDVHSRIGGFAGSNLQLANCPKTPAQSNVVNPNCIAAFMTMHVTKSGRGLYLENVWLWTADHDMDDPGLQQITIFTGRGLYVESDEGELWLYGTAVEHHALYQYQFASTRNVFMGQIQTEIAYYQPNPDATTPFPPVANLNDPDFAAYCQGRTGTCGDGWGLRILQSNTIMAYGAGLYSFFSNYSTTCSNKGNGETCQTQIFGIDTGGAKDKESKHDSSVYVYNLNTIGATSMIDEDGVSVASYADNINAFQDTIALFRN